MAKKDYNSLEEIDDRDYVSQDDSGDTYSQINKIAKPGIEFLRDVLLREKYGTSLLNNEVYKAMVIDIVDINAEKEKPKYNVIAYVYKLDNHIPKETPSGHPMIPSYIQENPALYTSLTWFVPKDLKLKKPAVGEIIYVSFSDASERTNPVFETSVGLLNYSRFIIDPKADPAAAILAMEEEAKEGILKEMQQAARDILGRDEADALGVDIGNIADVAKTFGNIINDRYKNNTNVAKSNNKKQSMNKFIQNSAKGSSAINLPPEIPAETVLDAAYSFSGGPYGSYADGYGIPIDINHGLFFAKKTNFISSFGFTWTVLFTILKNKKKLNNFSGDDIKRSMNLWRSGNFSTNITVIENLQAGFGVSISEVQPGDFIQFRFSDGRVSDKHSVIFLEWYNNGSQNIGFKCRSSFQSSNSISDKIVLFSSIDYDTISACRMRDI